MVTQSRSGFDHAAQLRVRILIDLMDRRAGQDIVELIEQQRFPRPLDLGTLVDITLQSRDRAERFRLEQAMLSLPIELLDQRLRCQCAAVELEIELPHPAGKSG